MMDDLDPELVEKVAMAAAYASGVSHWKHVSEHGDYDSREYWRRIASAALSSILPDLRAKHYAEALEMAAKACEEQRDDFLSEQYAVGQPMSSFSERFACGECAIAIRALKDAPHG